MEVIMKKGTLFTEKKRYYVICIILCAIILAPTLIIGIYNRPTADDFDYAILTHQAVVHGEGLLGILSAAWKTNVNFFNSWQGLYSSAFILSLQPAIFGEQMYELTPVIVMLYGYVFTLLSVHLLNKIYLKKSLFFSVTLSFVLLTLLMIWLPSATQGLYWYNGAMNYMPWAFTNIFNICLLLYIKNRPISLKIWITFILSIVLSFLTSGGDQVTSFANILFLLILSICFAFKKVWYPIIPFIAACVGFLIMYLAPGTAIRANAFVSLSMPQPSVIETIFAVMIKVRSILGEWVNITWILSLIAITPIGLEVAAKNKGRFSWRSLLIVLVSSIVIICGMFAVPYYAMGNFGALRVTNVIWITFMFLSWFNYVLVLGLLEEIGIINVEKILSYKYKSAILTCVICFAVGLSCIIGAGNGKNSNSVRTALELKNGTAKAYCAELDARFEIYHDSTVNEAKIKPLTTNSILFFSDIGTDPNVWPNTSISEYYGKPIYIVP